MTNQSNNSNQNDQGSNNNNNQGSDSSSQGSNNNQGGNNSNQGSNNNQGSSNNSNQSGQNQSGSNGDTSNRGFASMDSDKQRDIASEGGKAAHEQGTAHEFDSQEAREAGKQSHKNDNNS